MTERGASVSGFPVAMGEDQRQFILDLGHRPALAREDFLVADGNREAVAWIDRWPDWPVPALVLHGPPGCGKTHLAHVFAARAGAVIVPAASLDRSAPPRLLAAAAAVVVEDADHTTDEAALFHLYNLCREHGAPLVLTGAAPPSRWPLILPDLRSRLNATPAAAIAGPDDALMAAVLVKLFADRQIRVGDEVVGYLIRRMERSFAAARSVVETADALALASHRPVTIVLAGEALRMAEEACGG